jgi:L-aminopeptidase/D-esterase-like protein
MPPVPIHWLPFTDIPGVSVGHWSDFDGLTGVTVVLPTAGRAVASVDVRGYAAATQMTDFLDPRVPSEGVHAVVLTGGSSFGLASCAGVAACLEERGTGALYRGNIIPTVTGAVVYDLSVGDPRARPGPNAGHAACVEAMRGGPLQEGSIGAGTGATVGKLFGMERCMKGGLGGAALRLLDGTMVGALAVVNPVGDVIDEDGSILAGARDDAGGFIDSAAEVLTGRPPQPFAGGNTTLAVVATDAQLTQAECQRIAAQAHDGLALAVGPVHTTYDGDVVFTLSTGNRAGDPFLVGVAAVAAVRQAILRAVRLSRGLGGVPGAADRA